MSSLHGLEKAGVVGVLDGLHAGLAGGLDVVGAVVEKEDVPGTDAEAFGGVDVDDGVGFGGAEAVGEGVVMKIMHPGKAVEDAGFHGIAEVGKDAGADPGGLELGGPVDHGLVGLGPEGDVGVEEVVQVGWSEGMIEFGGDLAPVGGAGEGAAVVVVAGSPVGFVEGGVGGGEDALHGGPGSGVGGAGEHQAVVEEDGVDRFCCGGHALMGAKLGEAVKGTKVGVRDGYAGASMRFSERTAWEPGVNAWAEAVEVARADGRVLVDLTVANPTVCGLGMEAAEVLRPLGDAGALRYVPEPFGMVGAREAVAEYCREHGAEVEFERICLTTSTSEGYSFLFRLLCDPGDEVLIARPSYPLFDLLARLDDVVLREYPLFYEPGHGWGMDVAGLEERITARTRAVVVVHPNNPTGSYVSPEEREALAALCAARGLALIVDEVFLDYAIGEVGGETFASGVGCLCFVLSGLSKICALPQMKASWIVTSGPEALVGEAVRRLEIVADTFLSMNAPVQFALGAWLRGRGGVQGAIRRRMVENVAALDMRLEGSLGSRLALQGGWTAVLRVPRFVEGEEFALAALRRGVLVQPGVFYGLPEGRCVVSLLTEPEIWGQGLALLPV